MTATSRVTAHRRIGLALGALAFLSACGGGGAGGGGVISTPGPAPTPSPTPAPAPSPTPTPTPTPPPTNFDTAEYRRSDGPTFHNAVSAWSAGINGAGATIAIIDTGIDIDSPEFVGRISSASADVAGNRGIDAEDDHGTNVALVAAAARDNTGVVGIAYGAQIQALRTDSPGSCATGSGASLDGCEFFDRDIAAGVDSAVAAGARVINLSLGGGTPSPVLVSAVQRAAAAGLVIVVSAGNDGDSTDPAINPNQPDPFASGLLAVANRNVIIVGSVDDTGQFSAFSNRAGNEGLAFLSARGERICCVYDNGVLQITTDASGTRFVTLFSGTSFAAPQVSGAVALLAQAFPNLTGQQIVEILLTSARDAGAAGVDAVFGRGILDISRALAPSGTTTLAGSTSFLPLGDQTGVASTPMGDALVRAPIDAIITDKYARAYTYDLGSRFSSAAIRPKLLGAVENSGRRVEAGNGVVALAFTISNQSYGGDLRSAAQQLRLSPTDARMARILAARVALRLSPDMQMGFAMAEGADSLIAQLQGHSRPAFLIAGNAVGDSGFLLASDASFALRKQAGQWGISLGADSGRALLGRIGASGNLAFEQYRRRPVQSFSLTADRRFGRIETALGLTWMREDNTILGAYFHDALGASGADTIFADFGIGAGFAPMWRLGAAFRQGLTHARQGGIIGRGSSFASQAWSFDVTRSHAFTQGDSLGLRISQPLRVSGGGLNLDLPVSYDYATQSAGFGIRRLALAPTGREVTGELAWRGPIWGGDAAASLFYRRDPGHYSAFPDDKGVAIRWSRAF